MQQNRILRRASHIALILSLALLPRVSTAALISQEFEHSIYGARPKILNTDRSTMGVRTDFAQTSQRRNSTGQAKDIGTAFVETVATTDGTYARSYKIDATYVQMTPYWGYGLTKNMSVFASLPLYQISTSAREVLVKENDQISTNNVSSTKRALVESPKSNEQQLIVGQAVIALQYGVDQTGRIQTSLTSKVRVPTGDRNDLTYFSQGIPDAQGYGLGFGFITSTWLGAGFEFLTGVEGTYNFNDDVYVRDNATAEILKTTRDPGETGLATATLDKKVFGDSHLQVGYSFEKKWADVLPDDVSAEGSEAGSGQRINLAYAYRPDNFLTASRLASRMAAKISYSGFLGGENTLDADTAALEFSVSY